MSRGATAVAPDPPTRPPAGGALGAEFFARDPVVVARELIGHGLLRDGVGGVIVETEAYREDDPASHSFGGPGGPGGRRRRARTMFGEPGTIYVYRSYGLHWCVNLVCGAAGTGAAVLLRALEPAWDLARMRARRGGVADRLLAAGPGRLTQALGIDGTLDGAWAVGASAELALVPPDGPARMPVVAGPRIGISRAAERPWRFGAGGSRHLSRPFPEDVGR